MVYHKQYFIFPLYKLSHSLLRHYATSQKVVGSIPNEVTGFFSWPNPSSHIMVLGSTQPLTEINTKNLDGGERAANA
jgi:hypothetical protein